MILTRRVIRIIIEIIRYSSSLFDAFQNKRVHELYCNASFQKLTDSVAWRRIQKKKNIRLSMVVTRCHCITCESENQSEYRQRGNSLLSVSI